MDRLDKCTEEAGKQAPVRKASNKRLILLVLVVAFFTLLLIACAPKQSTNEPAAGGSDEGTETTVELPEWSITSDCASCHVTETESGTNTACTYSLHTATTCVTCHSDDDGKLKTGHEKYATAKQPTKLKKTSVDASVCESCHDTEEIKQATVTSVVLTDTEGTVVNPHDLPATDNHAASVDCSSCHKMHLATPVEETAKKACASCHHAGVYSCGTCHD